MSLQIIQNDNEMLYELESDPITDDETLNRLHEKLVEDIRQERNQNIKYLGNQFPCYTKGHVLVRNSKGHWICNVCHLHSILHDATHKEGGRCYIPAVHPKGEF